VSHFRGYIVHNYKLPERKKYLQHSLGSASSFSFIEIENINPDYIADKYLGLNEGSWQDKTRSLWSPPPQPRALTFGEIACTASHFYIYEKFLKDDQEEWLVIIEDDAIFDCDLSQEIIGLLNDLPDMIGSIFIGGGFNHDAVSLTLGGYKNFLIKHHPATNTTVAYILRRNMVKAIMRNFTKFDLPIDYELAYLLMINNAIVLHKIPYIVKEGSKSFYESSIR
jgi:GR25 family glycosyltransferase involved in LPS biosynthesis